MSDTTPKFKIKDISFPKIDSLFISLPLTDDFEYSFRIEGQIVSEKSIRLLFGVRLLSTDQIDEKTPKARITVEAFGDFEFEENLPNVNHVAGLPLAANMLALMYPFIREKIYYCFSNNKFSVFLPPVNTIQLLKDNANNPNFKIEDTRSAAQLVASGAVT